MTEDILLLLGVAFVWTLLAIGYAVAPWGDMIGYARVWGSGAVLFFVVAALVWNAARQS